MPPTCALLVFAKPPIPGRVKTRLAASLGAAGAAALHRACVADAIRLASRIPACAPRLVVAPGANGWPANDLSLPRNWSIGTQRGRGLGERLERAFAEEFQRGMRKVAVIGTDTPWMGERAIRTAFRLLDDADVALGPAIDGGYYLLAARRFLPPLFRGIPWGTAETLNATRRALERGGILYRMLPLDFDLDRPEDLERASSLLASEPSRAAELAAWLAAHDRRMGIAGGTLRPG